MNVSPRLRVGLRAFAVIAGLALLAYVAHIVLGLGAVVALGLVGAEPLTVAAGCGVAFFAVAVLVSWVWKRVWRYGPLEKLMRATAG